MDSMASQITSLTFVYSTVYSGADQRKHQSSASLAFVWGIHRGAGTGEFPAHMASNAENVSIWWRHHAKIFAKVLAILSRSECVKLLIDGLMQESRNSIANALEYTFFLQ